MIIKDINFPWDPVQAIKNGFDLAEREFIKLVSDNALKNDHVDRSGSCAIVIIIVGDICYVANVGDSRAIISSSHG